MDFAVRITADPPIIADVTVDCKTSNDTAIAGEDYTAVDKTFTFSSGGVTEQTCSIPILDDNLNELSESFDVGLSGATGGASVVSGILGSADVTILDDDPPPVASVKVSEATASEGDEAYSFDIELNVKSGRSIPVVLRYMFDNAGTAMFGTAPGSGIDYVVRGGTKDAAGMPTTDGTGALLIPKGDTAANIVIELQDEQDVELEETVVLTLVPPTTTFGHGLDVNAAAAQTVLTIRNDDGSVLSARAMGEGSGAGNARANPKRVAEVSVNDQGATVSTWAEFAVELEVAASSAGQEATFRMSASGSTEDTAVAGADYSLADDAVTVTGGSLANDVLTVAAGTTATVRIPILDDDILEDDEIFAIVLEGLTGTSETASIFFRIDDDDIPAVMLTPSSVGESVGTATFTASLDGTAAGGDARDPGRGGAGGPDAQARSAVRGDGRGRRTLRGIGHRRGRPDRLRARLQARRERRPGVRRVLFRDWQAGSRELRSGRRPAD